MFVAMQAVGALGIMPLLDSPKIGSRRTRGLVSTTTMGLVTIATWIGLLVWLDRNPLDPLSPPLWGWDDGPFGGFFALTLLLGINMVVVSAFPRSCFCRGRRTNNSSIKWLCSGLLRP